MFVYMFDHWYGSDRVVYMGGLKESGVLPGDLLSLSENYGLCLGEHISFEEKYTYEKRVEGEVQICIERLISRKTLKFLHHFVNHWFTTYKNTVPLFLSGRIDHLIKYRKRTKQKKKKQSLVVYPTLWSLLQNSSAQDRKDAVVLHSGMTSVQKSKAYRQIKQGEAMRVMCTYSQIFQDRSSLQDITLYDQHAWWYKHQQDPRYFTPRVIEHLADHSGAQLVQYGHDSRTKFA